MKTFDAQNYYTESQNFLQTRKKRQVKQLVLLNNLQRGDQNIASTLLLTLFNRTLSALYDDKLQVKFLPSQGIMQEQLNAYNTLYQSDYLEMDKARIDYDWMWDTLFFGRGYVETSQFDYKRKIMVPRNINPLAFGYDPYVDDTKEWRYYWKWITRNKWQIMKLIKDGTITGIKDIKELPSGVDEYLWEYKVQRENAKEGISPAKDTVNNDVFQILEMYGYDENGDKCVFWYDRDISILLMKEKLDYQDGENGESIWPIVCKEAFREPHSSIPFSVADILEDKHRAKSVLLNLAYIAAKDQANPLYWYDPDKVKDLTQLFSRQINQHIPVEGDGNLAIGPLNTKGSMPPEVLNFITMLQGEANDPVGTGVEVRPDSGPAETATAKAIDQQLNDMAQSLQSKILQFGEKEFCSHWFHRYQRNADALGKKMANIVGVKGIDTKEIDLKMFKTKYPPGVMVYSAKEAEYKDLVKRRELSELYPQLAASIDPEGLKNFNKHILFPLYLDDPSLTDLMFPKSLDELKAEGENDILAKDKYAPIGEQDEHSTHIYIHSMLQPKTWALWVHIYEHQEALAKQKQQQQQEAMAMAQGTPQETPIGENKVEPGGPQMGGERQSPMDATSPLKTETKSEING